MKFFAMLFGLAFVALGILGFMPAYVIDGNLFGIFEVNAAHNMVHIACGVLALLAATSIGYSRLYFQFIGIIFGIATVWGFAFGGDLYIAHTNMADNILNLAITVVALYFGFIFKTHDW